MDRSVDTKIGVPSSRNLVYTSAGDWSNLHYWLKGNKKFDLWITYYGNKGPRYKESADFYNIRQGSKWQNLYDIYQRWPKILDHYEAILVMDDDILINASSIDRLFAIQKQYDLWVCQAAYDFRGKIRHQITSSKPENFMRYVSFVENTCPVFKKVKLDDFMKVYDGSLLGNGVDYWYLDVLGAETKDKFAVIDAVRCINPFDQDKGGTREYANIDKQPWKELSADLEGRYGIKSHLMPYKEYSFVPNKSICDQWSGFLYKVSRKIQRPRGTK